MIIPVSYVTNELNPRATHAERITPRSARRPARTPARGR
jgi:hypothetical protein